MTLGNFTNVQGTKLLDIRAMLNSANGLSFRLYINECSSEKYPYTNLRTVGKDLLSATKSGQLQIIACLLPSILFLYIIRKTSLAPVYK